MSDYRQRGAMALRAQRARMMAGQPTYGFFDTLKSIGRGIATVATGIIPGTLDDKLVSAVLGSSSPQQNRQTVTARANCPPGFRANPNTGICEVEGPIGAIQRFVPGGQTGTLPQANGVPAAYGNAVMGSFGVPALQPAQASAMSLRCPPGSVLGKDNLCYQKGSIPMQFRKWRPAKKPPISAKDWRALQTSARVEKKAKNIAMKAGFSCRKR